MTAIFSIKLSEDNLRNMQSFLTNNFGLPFKVFMPKKMNNPPSSYIQELGDGLITIIYIFLNNISKKELLKCKYLTMNFEKHNQSENGRIINLNPGFINRDGVFLISHKYRSRRKYLGDNIWYEKQLNYKNLLLHTKDYTFPELSDPIRLEHLNSFFISMFKKYYKKDKNFIKQQP